MKIEIIKKQPVRLTPYAMSEYIVYFRADGNLLYQRCHLSDDITDDILIQLCEGWAKKLIAKGQPPTSNI